MTKRTKAILDSCVLVDILRGNKHDLTKKTADINITECGIADLTRFELLNGAYLSKEKEKNIKLVTELCKQFKEWNSASGFDLAAKEKARLKNEGLLIPDIDLFIGCMCSANNIPLITGNIKHMERISGIKIIKW